MRRFIYFILSLIISSAVFAGQSTIVQADGYACMNEDRTKRQTEEIALQDAKRNALEQAQTYIKSETMVKNLELQKDLINAFAEGQVKVLEILSKWDNEPPRIGDCYRITIKSEVIPNEKALKKVSDANLLDDPTAPLQVKLWTDKDEYKSGDKIKIYLKGNKPFYAIVLYKDAKGEILQLLPNPHRKDNYFNGGVTYIIPSGDDRFELEVTPPFGEEEIMIYASTTNPGELNKEDLGIVYGIKTKSSEIAEKVRGISIKPKTALPKESGKIILEEFFEIQKIINTRR